MQQLQADFLTGLVAGLDEAGRGEVEVIPVATLDEALEVLEELGGDPVVDHVGEPPRQGPSRQGPVADGLDLGGQGVEPVAFTQNEVFASAITFAGTEAISPSAGACSSAYPSCAFARATAWAWASRWAVGAGTTRSSISTSPRCERPGWRASSPTASC